MMKSSTRWLLTGAGLAALAIGPSLPVLAASSPAQATTTPAANLRIELDQLLGAHAVLAQLAMEAGYKGASDYSGYVSQLNQNTAALSQAIAGIYGAAAGAEFQKMWQGHITDFVNYVIATKEHNAAGQQAAIHALEQYKTQFANFLAGADPHINATTLADSLQVHITQILATFNAYVKGQYATSAQDFVTAYDHMFMDGDYLAGAIAQQFPAKFAGTSPDTAAVNLRATLDELLGAHAVLAQLAMRAGYLGTPMYQPWASVLSQNTASLSAAIGSVYGAQAGQKFQVMWQGHITDFVNYVVATKENNTTAQSAAKSALEQYKTQFAAFLASANPHFNATILADSLQVHVNQLLATFTAFVGGQETTATTDFTMAYQHMFMDGDYLASGIVQQFPSQFGVSMSGATSPVTGFPILPMAIAGGAAALVGATLLRRRPAHAIR